MYARKGRSFGHFFSRCGAAGVEFPPVAADRNYVKALWFVLFSISALAQNKPADAVPPQPADAAPASFGDAIRQQLEAARIQREAVRKQAEAAAQFRVSVPIAPIQPAADCDPLPPAEMDPIVDAAAQKNQLQTALLRSVIDQESGGRPCAVSPRGAQGLMQLMPDTVDTLQVADPFDPRQNVEAGAKYLKQLLDKYKGDLSLALAAYNAGPKTVDQANGVPAIPETRNYVDSITKRVQPDAVPAAAKGKPAPAVVTNR
jgi:soluble lytic murein transglycosylase-like protein